MENRKWMDGGCLMVDGEWMMVNEKWKMENGWWMRYSAKSKGNIEQGSFKVVDE